MRHYLVDPYLVTLPAADSSKDQVKHWLSALNTWLDEIDAALFPWHHSSECTTHLQQGDNLPNFTKLRTLTNRHSLDFNISLISRRLTQFLSEENCVTGHLSTRAALYDSAKIEPSELLNRAPTTQSKFEHGLICIACDANLGNKFTRNLSCITTPLRDAPQQIDIAGTIIDIETDVDSSALKNKDVSHQIPILYSPHDLFGAEACADVVHHKEAGFQAAVRAEAHKTYPKIKPLNFTIGSQFWASVEASEIHRNLTAFGKTIRIAASVVANQAHEMKADLRHLRESEAADAKQLERKSDGGKAWRLTITPKGVGWRMQYWHIPPGTADAAPRIEFANILKKGDAETIPE